MEFSSDLEMKKIAKQAHEFHKYILDDEPFFVSDEANIFDVSGAEPEELLARICGDYGGDVSMTDLQQPPWKLIRQLNERRNTGRVL